jgi:hypothetical protein
MDARMGEPLGSFHASRPGPDALGAVGRGMTPDRLIGTSRAYELNGLALTGSPGRGAADLEPD